jgi:alpha-ribazole phosphatase
LLAQAISSDRLVLDERLVEMDFGDWEMYRFDDLPRAMIDAWAANPLGFRVPGGETGEEVLVRAEAVLDEILARDGSVVIVAHGGPLRAIRGKLMGLPREEWLGQELPLASLTSLRRQGTQWIADALARFGERSGEK